MTANIHTTTTDQHGHPHTATPRGRYLFTLSLAALGVVYGDIGTSPLYTFAAIVGERTIEPILVLGGFSAVFWTLTIQTTIKYSGRKAKHKTTDKIAAPNRICQSPGKRQ